MCSHNIVMLGVSQDEETESIFPSNGERYNSNVSSSNNISITAEIRKGEDKKPCLPLVFNYSNIFLNPVEVEQGHRNVQHGNPPKIKAENDGNEQDEGDDDIRKTMSPDHPQYMSIESNLIVPYHYLEDMLIGGPFVSRYKPSQLSRIENPSPPSHNAFLKYVPECNPSKKDSGYTNYSSESKFANTLQRPFRMRWKPENRDVGQHRPETKKATISTTRRMLFKAALPATMLFFSEEHFRQMVAPSQMQPPLCEPMEVYRTNFTTSATASPSDPRYGEESRGQPGQGLRTNPGKCCLKD